MSEPDYGSSSADSADARASATSLSLLARVRTNDPHAWEQLVELYAPFVFRLCRAARLSADDAKDVFQDVFQAAFRHLGRFRRTQRGDTFRGWLRVITRNKIHDVQRRHMREPRGAGGSEMRERFAQVMSPEETASTSSVVIEDAELVLCRAALLRIRGEFRERTWQAFLGTVLDGRTPSDVGEELGMSPGAVRVAKSRVLKRLRAELCD